jgi:hypothetical protein
MMYLGFAMMNLSMLEANMNAGNEKGNGFLSPIYMLNTDRCWSRQAPDDLEKNLTEDPLRFCVCVRAVERIQQFTDKEAVPQVSID